MRLLEGHTEVRSDRPDAITVDWRVEDGRLAWSVANDGDRRVAVEAVAVVWRIDGAVEPLRVLRHGYQSWSPTAVATFGVDDDPSRTPGTRSLLRGMHHADAAVAAEGELRSELVTALRDAAGSVLVAGFLGGADHDGTFRVRPARDGTGIELLAEAHLGGARFDGGEVRALHDVWFADGEGDPAPLLEAWATALGARAAARTAAPYQVGWCSWYHYFEHVTEADWRANLANAGDWPFDVFQLDDGYQAAIGDWLDTNPTFPSPLDALADAVAATGMTPGLWLAPFVAGPGSSTAAAHPDWFATHVSSGERLAGMVNAAWLDSGATSEGVVHALDTTNPEVLEHLEEVARSLVARGFPYLKLDFTYAPSLPGAYADPTRTPAQRVRAGYEAIRRGAGRDAFLLGCGAPLGPVVGLVDGMRIGPDVAPWWHPKEGLTQPGYPGSAPATVNAWRNTLSRSFLHRRLWLNDPDCLMLRSEHTELSPAAARAWALAVGVSGGMALVSDDLALLGRDERALFDEVVALGRRSDDAQRAHPARCDDLLDHDPPRLLHAHGALLTGVPDAATAVVTARS